MYLSTYISILFININTVVTETSIGKWNPSRWDHVLFVFFGNSDQNSIWMEEKNKMKTGLLGLTVVDVLNENTKQIYL